jgi:hypothetical protein
MPKQPFDPFNLDSILGPPPALQGRDLEEFYRLYQLLCDDLKPESLSDQIEVRLCAEKLLEMRRLKASVVSLISSADFESLLKLLPPSGRYEDVETAKDYYSEDKGRRQKAEAYLRRLEITRTEIRANSVHLRHETVALLERLISDREAAWRRTIKYFRKAGRTAAKQGTNRLDGKIIGLANAKARKE